MNYHKYEKYKNSGSKWIGEIPEHWRTRKLRLFARIQPSNVDKKSVEDQELVRLCNYTDVYYNEYIDSSINFMEATASDSQIRKFTLKKGDIIITKDSETPLDIAVPAYVPTDLPGIICGYHLAMIHLQKDLAFREYFFRAFQSESISHQYSASANGLTRYGLTVHAIGDVVFPLPPLNEQKEISKYLKNKTIEIDALIADKEKMVELLQEYRQAVITEAVTRGLDPNTEMKESGIEWIGKVPKDWCLLKIFYLIEIESGKRDKGGALAEGEIPSLGGEYINNEGGIIWDNLKYISNTLFNSMKKGKLQLEDVILVKDGATTGKVAFVDNLKYNKVAVNEHVYLFRSNNKKKLCNKYLFYMTYSNLFKSQIEANFHGMIGGVTLSNLKSIIMPIPSTKVQSKIINFLDLKFIEILDLISNMKNQIKNLQDYRRSIISGAVTGKINVNNYI